MTELVKKFIEHNIGILEGKHYYDAFLEWYLHYAPDRARDYDNLQSLFKTFGAVDINLYQESEEARYKIIEDQMEEYIVDVLDNDPDRISIGLADVIKHLDSDLDIRLIDRNNIFKKIGSRLSTTRGDVKVLPFRIVRIEN